MYSILAFLGKICASLSHLIVTMGTIGLIGEVKPPKSLLK